MNTQQPIKFPVEEKDNSISDMEAAYIGYLQDFSSVEAAEFTKRVNAYDELIAFARDIYERQQTSTDHWIWLKAQELLYKFDKI